MRTPYKDCFSKEYDYQKILSETLIKPKIRIKTKLKLPEFSINTVQTWKIGDSVKLLPTISDKSIDLIITDPPYGINKEGIINDKDLSIYYQTLPEMYRVLKNNTFFITFVSIGRLPDFFLNNPFKYRWQYIYYISNGMVRGNIGFNNYISILIFQKGNAKMKNPIEDIMKVTTSSEYCGKRIHPTEKSVDVLKRLLYGFSNIGDTVLDPFLGSGSLLEACAIKKRNCIGFEINPKWEYIYSERIKKIEKRNLFYNENIYIL